MKDFKRNTFLQTVLLLVSMACRAQSLETADWFEFKPTDYHRPGAINMTDWLDAPAGKHGFLQIKGKDFAFEDGTPVKFWGVNIASNKPFCSHEEASEWTRILTKYGVNGVRFHKFTWYATDGIHSTQITDANWKNFDFFCKSLRDAGVYYSWSHIYGHKVMKADSARMLAYTELKNTKFPWAHLNGTTVSLVNYAEDLQAINIELTVNMLNHLNPLTGKRYADDPALSFIELQNEDDIFWGAIEETLKQTPTYRALLCKKFSAWLLSKYKTNQQLMESWHNQGIEPGQSLAQENIYPNPSHGFFSAAYERAVLEKRPVPMHVADRATFLYEEQSGFYQRFIKAIRETGYKGVIVGSCWQAGSGISHFYNLHSDYVAGAIDRHNYFGGGRSHVLKPGKFDNSAMVSRPGSGLLSTGFQQVADRPFQISEWMSLIPTEWTAESAPLVAAYGMGLQGWDASYAFAMDQPHYSKTIQQGTGVYNIASPTHLAFYPALAAMVYRGDVKEGAVIANRNVNIKDLAAGKINFIEKTSQQYDVKSFESSVPMEALAVGAVTLSFDGQSKDLQGGISRYWSKEKKQVLSSTGQLAWNYDGKGFSTIDTPGTKALIGFAKDKDMTFGNLKLKTSNPFAVIFISSLDRNKSLDQADRWLITTVARAQNTGMKWSEDRSELLDIGAAPIILEPVEATVHLLTPRKGKLYVLDHVGSRTGEVVEITGSDVILSGSKYGAIYYEMVFTEPAKSRQ